MGVPPYQQSHPYTDVSQIKQKGDFSCINFSCGYYNMHTSSEFVVVKDVEDAFNLAVGVVKELGNVKYEYTYVRPTYDYYSQGSLFANYDDDEDDFNYDETDWVDGNNHYFHISEDEIEIESKSTGDIISLNLKDMGELYLLIRERLLENEEI
jgi:hypothetical protein